jgi:hypothetical protein
MACEPASLMKINLEGRCWARATGAHKAGGDWLVGRCIRVFYDKEKAWFPGIVTGYDPNGAKDALQAAGPVHDISYEDGSYLEDLSTGKWEYDACEGAAGDFWEDAPGQSSHHLQSVESTPSSSLMPPTKGNQTAKAENGSGAMQSNATPQNARPQCIKHAPAQHSQGSLLRPPDSRKEKSIADAFVVVKSSSKSKDTKLSMPLQGTILLGKVKGYPWWPAKVQTDLFPFYLPGLHPPHLHPPLSSPSTHPPAQQPLHAPSSPLALPRSNPRARAQEAVNAAESAGGAAGGGPGELRARKHERLLYFFGSRKVPAAPRRRARPASRGATGSARRAAAPRAHGPQAGRRAGTGPRAGAIPPARRQIPTHEGASSGRAGLH